MDKCLECNEGFETEESLHRHLRAHHLKIDEYYHKHFPRKDLFTGELIQFKSKKFYFSNDFNSRSNFKEWLMAQKDFKVVKEYFINFLKRRKEDKSLLYAPCQVELKTLPVPSLKNLNKLFGNVYTVFHDLGLLVKYETVKPFPMEKDPTGFIHVDTREQEPLEFSCDYGVDTLKFGDYAYSYGNPRAFLNVCIERKSLQDFVASFGSGVERIEREMERARGAGYKVLILVESSLKDAMEFNRERFSKATPEFVFHNVRDLIQKFPNIQFLFVNGRPVASKIIETLFYSKGEIFRFDLQFMYDSGLLTDEL